MGPIFVTWQDIRAWCDMTGEEPRPWESRLILRLSVMRANIEGEAAERERQRKGK